MNKLESAIRAFVRREANVRNSQVPVIEVEEEGHAPIVIGTQGGWFTRGGARIAHPTAYAKVGWSNMEYWGDDRYILVGARWIENQLAGLVKGA